MAEHWSLQFYIFSESNYIPLSVYTRTAWFSFAKLRVCKRGHVCAEWPHICSKNALGTHVCVCMWLCVYVRFCHIGVSYHCDRSLGQSSWPSSTPRKNRKYGKNIIRTTVIARSPFNRTPKQSGSTGNYRDVSLSRLFHVNPPRD